MARELGLALPAPKARRRYGQRRHYAVEPWSDLIEVHWTRAGEIYVTPTADGMVGLSLLARQGTHFDEAIAAAPELAARIRGAEPASALRGRRAVPAAHPGAGRGAGAAAAGTHPGTSTR